MFPLWVNLPAKFKFVEPSHQDISHEDKGICTSEEGAVKALVIVGENCGVFVPART